MGITSALVLLAVIWWMTFLIVLPFKVKTQGDMGHVEPGTHAGSPEVHNIPKKSDYHHSNLVGCLGDNICNHIVRAGQN